MKRWARLARDARFRRSEQRALIEGPHLLAALLDGGRSAEALMVSELRGHVRYVSEQPPYNLLDRRIENELVPLALSILVVMEIQKWAWRRYRL